MRWSLCALASVCLHAGLAAAAERAAAAPPGRPAQAPYAGSTRALIAERELATALARVRNDAEAGDRDARYLLGMMLLNGVGAPVDAAEARTWLQRAAEQDHASAAFVLAWLLGRDAGHGDAAHDWLERAARLGDARAVEALRDPDGPLHAVWPAAGDATARAALALYAARHDDVALLERLGDASRDARDDFGQTALALAVDTGAARACEWLLAHGADVRRADSRGVTPVMRAAARPDPALLVTLLAQGADVNAQDAEKRTATMIAARQDRTQNLERLRAAGADLAARDSRDYNALDIALLANATHAAGQLREWGLRPAALHGAAAKPGLFDAAHPGELYRDWPPAALAAAREDAATLRQLLDGGASPNLRLPQGDTLLHVAFHAGADATFALLLSRGADAAAPDRRGRSVLGLAAAAADRGDRLDDLLKAHVSADAHAPGEAAPLIAALRAGNVAGVTRLLAAGASPNVRDEDGQPALSLSALAGDGNLLPLLLQQKPDVNARDPQGHGALWAAVVAGNAERLRLLLAAGANADTPDAQGLTPLAVAAASGRVEIVEQLLRARASVAHADRSGDTPLHAAAAAGQAAVVQALLRASAPTDAVNLRGDTPLIVASRAGHLEACRLLLAAGSKTTLRNKNRQTAADVARNRGFTAVADLLDRKG